MVKQNIETILTEISTVLEKVDSREVENLIDEINTAHTIVLTGAGRVGMAMRGFAMRLGHLGRSAYMVGDATVPAITAGDLLIIASGSGETQTVYDLAVIAKQNGARIALITGNPQSRMGELADTIIKIDAPSKTKQVAGFKSIQPMTTLNEQCLSLFCDAVVLCLMEKFHETHDTMWHRHSNLE